MKTQLSRKTFDALKRYSGVYQQMGRMLTDADWNELSDLNKQRIADVLTDIIGSGTPKERGIMEITELGDGSNSYRLLWGYDYVDGIVCQLRPDQDAVLIDPAGELFEYLHQADFPQAAPEPVADHTLYLDVWERPVTSLEDGELIDPGLHGADTCTRTQTMAQIKWCPLTIEPENQTHNPTIGNSVLTLQLREGSTDPDPCDPCADEITLQGNVGNYLFRVEIHHVEYDAATGLADRVFIKWSSENGAEQYTLTDKPPGFVSSKWSYEFFSGEAEQFASEKHLGMHHAPGFNPVRGEMSDSFSEPAGYSLVRRWDGYCELTNIADVWTLVNGVDRGTELSDSSSIDAPGHFQNGSIISINLESITLDLDLSSHQLVAGDYWQATVRQATDVAGTVILTSEHPHGILHHYMTLGSVIAGDFSAYEGEQCKRFEFPSLTNITAKDVCYDSDCDDFSDAGTVEGALDKLCKQNDLKWHNKHLHGWGIVCGLIAQCNKKHLCDEQLDEGAIEEEIDPEVLEALTAQQAREVVITEGYALTCEGDDVNLKNNRTLDVIDRINRLEENGALILDNSGNGSICLRIELDNQGLAQIITEPYNASSSNNSLLDGSLLKDFFDDCIVDLLEDIVGEFKFLDTDELDTVEGGSTGLVSTQRRKFTSFLNLIFQFINSSNGGYIFLSRKEHLILRDLYETLKCLLRSKTFCAMYEGQEFPEYPFQESGMTTYFGKNNHTRVKIHPSGNKIYTYGGADNTINVYNTETEELINVIKMPSVEGAEVSAISFSKDGEILYAAASIRAIDTVFGMAKINDDFSWDEMIVICNLEIMEMEVSIDDPGLIYALGHGKGLYYLRPDILLDETKPQPVATYDFNAVGHMRIDTESGRAYCTSNRSSVTTTNLYDQVLVCDLNQSGELLTANIELNLLSASGGGAAGTDGIAIGPNHLYVVVNNSASVKQLWTYDRPLESGDQLPSATINIENTQIGLAYHNADDSLILSMEDGYRLQKVESDGASSEFIRIPVQIQPIDLVVNNDNGNIYSLNFTSNTLSLIPAAELNVSEDFLLELTSYRSEVLLAFYNLFGGLLQYLKDCFCDHLLVKFPTCEDEKLYLASVEIRNNEVYKICNLDKGIYVKSLPTVDYWLSLVPILPLIKKAVSSICCSVLPDHFSKYQDRFLPKQVDTPTHHMAFNESNYVSANTARKGMQTYQRTDFDAIKRDNVKGFKFAGSLAKDTAINQLDTGRRTNIGVKKQVLMGSSVNEAEAVLLSNRVQVNEIKSYDAKDVNVHMVDYVSTPERIEPGSKVTLYEKDGKVVYYAVEKQSTVVSAAGVSEETKIEIAELENRKSSLSDLSDLKAELNAAETRRNNVTELDSVKVELAELQAEKNTMQAELASIKSQVDSVKSLRKEEELKLQEMDSLRTSMADNILNMNESLLAMDNQRKSIDLEITKSRPPIEVVTITSKENDALKVAGIRTMNDLAKANANTLAEISGLSPAKANTLINNAKNRLLI